MGAIQVLQASDIQPSCHELQERRIVTKKPAFRAGSIKMERVTRFERATSSLARKCSTTELHPRVVRGDEYAQNGKMCKRKGALFPKIPCKCAFTTTSR